MKEVNNFLFDIGCMLLSAMLISIPFALVMAIVIQWIQSIA